MNRVIVILLCLLGALAATPQTSRLFSSDGELSNSLVNDVFQDSHGMVWIATEDGLNRFDGAKVTVYRHEPGNQASLVHNYIYDVFEDRDGNLLIGSYGGVQLYNRPADSFFPPFRFSHSGGQTGSVLSMFQSSDGQIWTFGSTCGAITAINPDGTASMQLQQFDNICMTGANNGIEDRAGNVWLLADAAGIFRRDKDGTWHHYFGRPGDPVAAVVTENPVSGLFFGSNAHGLLRYDPDTDRLLQVTADNAPLLIKDLYADSNGDVFIASDGMGLMKYRHADATVHTVDEGLWSVGAASKKIHNVIRDNDGNLWLSVYQKFVAMVSDKVNTFRYIGPKSAPTDRIGANCVLCMMRDRKGRLWVGTDNDGIYLLDSTLTQSTHICGGDIPAVVTSLFEDSRGNIWVGAYSGKGGHFDARSGQYIPLVTDDGQGNRLDSFYGFAEDMDGNVWFGTLGSGIYRYRLDSAQIDRIESDRYTRVLFYSPRSRSLYYSSSCGLVAVRNPESEDATQQIIADGCIVHAAKEDADGMLWLATSDGLKTVDCETGQVNVYTTADGLPVNTVYGIEFGHGNVWASTSRGLARFDCHTGAFTGYFVDNGLQSNEFYKNSSARDDDGNIYFGGINGITYFHPDSVAMPGRRLSVRLTDIYVSGKPFRPTDGQAVCDSRHIALPSTRGPVTVEFATRQLGKSESVIYAYSLDRDQWVTLPAGVRSVSFGDMSAGRHTLRIMAIDSGVESDITEIRIDIAWPWYLGWKAWCAYALLLAGMAWLSVSLIRSRADRRKQIRERNYARQVNEARTQFFINVSHEIRSPMSLVIAPIQKLLESENDPARRHTYSLIHRNAERVLRLVNELMDIRKIEQGQMKLNYRQVEMTPFVDDICLTYSEAVAAKNITLTFNHDGADTMKAWIDPANFDKVLVNLLSNALKFTPEGGLIAIRLRHDGNQAEITVTDSGPGIADNEKPKVFDRFYQVMDNHAGGSGVGLHLTHALVRLHGGTITVTDNPDGPGSRFTVTIPLDRPDGATDGAGQPAANLHQPHPADTPATKAPTASATAKPARRPTVHIAEDDPEIRAYLAEEFTAASYHVKTFNNGAEALDGIFAAPPDLLISDVMMPEMDGLTLLRKIRQNVNLNHLPVILLTAKGEDSDTLQGLRSGADAYIAKPFNLQILRTVADNLVMSRLHLQNIYSGRQTQEDSLDNIDTTSTDDRLMERIMKVINSRMADPDFTIEEFASEVGMSRVHLHRKLKELTNQSPGAFLRNLRLQQAARLLADGKIPVAEVAYTVGFRNPNHFATAFKELFGMPPTAYAPATSNRQQDK